ncbi:MAG: hypothetical protein M1814_005412 [Vezdaea aestivalis]|nr:MAG: hypothetical protein M1814_005412 [Vezdaea aestivalis]
MSTVPRDSPSLVSIATASLILAVVGGYFVRQGLSLGRINRSSDSDSNEDGEEVDSSSSLASFPDNANEECKMVLVARTDLGMSTGKLAAQCSHATLACYKSFLKKAPTSPILKRWERQGQAKITLQVKSEEELEVLHAQAVSMGMAAEIIHDAGRTEIASGTATVLGIGPAPKSVVDTVTGQLRLLR